jgi:hypothetical protein
LRAQPRLLVSRLAGRLRKLVDRVGTPALLAAHEIDRATMHEGQDPRAGLAVLGQERPG